MLVSAAMAGRFEANNMRPAKRIDVLNMTGGSD
jgi:hypothetical protein